MSAYFFSYDYINKSKHPSYISHGWWLNSNCSEYLQLSSMQWNLIISIKYSNVIGFHSTFWLKSRILPRVKWVAKHSNIKYSKYIQTQDCSKSNGCHQFGFNAFIILHDDGSWYICFCNRPKEKREKGISCEIYLYILYYLSSVCSVLLLKLKCKHQQQFVAMLHTK